MLRAPQLDRLALPKQTAAPRESAFPFRRARRRIRTVIIATALITAVCAIAAPKTSAQDLGEIARQERTKKQNNPAPPATHVYTNEDMHHQQILTPEDQSRFSATTQPATVAPAKPASQLASELPPSPPTAQPAHLPGNADLPIDALPASSPRAKTNSAPATQTSTRANISAASTITIKSISTRPTQPVAKTVPIPATEPIAQVTPTISAQPRQPITQVSVAQIAAQSNDASIPTTVPQNEMPLGDVARYYRGIKHQSARANAQIDPGPANAPSAPASAITIPNEIPPNQMSLGDIARYFRAKKREESQQQSQEVATTQAPPISVSANRIPANQVPSNPVPSNRAASAPVHAIAPTSKYPLTLTSPLASLKRTPTGASAAAPSRVAPNAKHAVAPKRSASAQATSIRITSGDTLWQLARHYLGSATRWPELLALNPNIQNPKRLQVGAQLVLHPSNT